LLIRTAELSRDDLVLEVGAGTGGLSARLADAAGEVVSVEIDPAILALAREHVAGRANIKLLCADALRNKNELNPAVLAELDAAAAKAGCIRLKLVANLPYAVAAPLIANLLIAD